MIPVVAIVLVTSPGKRGFDQHHRSGGGRPSRALGIAAVMGAIAQNLMHVAGAALGAAALSWNYGYALAEDTVKA